jgi:hypothetical protein
LAASLEDNRDYHAGRYLRFGWNPRLGFPVLQENPLAFASESFELFSRASRRCKPTHRKVRDVWGTRPDTGDVGEPVRGRLSAAVLRDLTKSANAIVKG